MSELANAGDIITSDSMSAESDAGAQGMALPLKSKWLEMSQAWMRGAEGAAKPAAYGDETVETA